MVTDHNPANIRTQPSAGRGSLELVRQLRTTRRGLRAALDVTSWRVVPPLATFLRSAAISAVAYAVTVRWPAASAMVPVKLAVVSVLIGLGFVLLGELRPDESN